MSFNPFCLLLPGRHVTVGDGAQARFHQGTDTTTILNENSPKQFHLAILHRCDVKDRLTQPDI